MVVGMGLRSRDWALRLSPQFLAASTLHGLSCRVWCSRVFVSPCASLNCNLLDVNKWFLLWLTGVVGKLILVKLSFVGRGLIVELEWLCKTLSVLQWNSIKAWLYLTGNFGGAQSVFLFSLARLKLSDTGTLTERLEALAEKQSEAFWWGIETGICCARHGLWSSMSCAAGGAMGEAQFDNGVFRAVKSITPSIESGVRRTGSVCSSQSISSVWLLSLLLEGVADCSCFWKARSWPMKCRLGEMQGRLCLTKS